MFNIIIVEDNAELRQGLEDQLSHDGFLVAALEDGERLSDAINAHKPDAILLDLNLPYEDGIEIIKRVKLAYPRMGVVVLSGRVRTIDRKEAYEAGADVFLTKPAGKRVIATRKRSTKPSVNTAQLDALIEEATVDAYGDSEQASGFLACFEQIAVPFTTEVLGVEVSVTGFDLTDDEALVAVCRRGKATQRIPVLDLRLPTPPPEGHAWIAAYRRWRKGR